jgi:hypothetical protein
MCGLARPVVRRFVLNSVWMTYAVVRFVAVTLDVIFIIIQVSRGALRRVMSHFILNSV